MHSIHYLMEKRLFRRDGAPIDKSLGPILICCLYIIDMLLPTKVDNRFSTLVGKSKSVSQHNESRQSQDDCLQSTYCLVAIY